MSNDGKDITRLLVEGRAGDQQSRDQALSLLYDNLHQIARQLLAARPPTTPRCARCS
jgi:hypothetical protein